jgi:MFS family permease
MFMIIVLRQRNFFLLWVAGLISYSGNWMLKTARLVVVYQLTESTIAVGGIVLASVIPGILLSSFAGVFIDRWERKRSMVIVNLLLALSVLPLLLVRSADHLWILYAAAFAEAALGQFFAPAENAMLPLLVDVKYLVSANALNSLNNSLARLIGPALGGVIVSASGMDAVVLIDAVSYSAAALLIALISVTSQPSASGTPRHILTDWRDGLRFIQGNRLLSLLCVFAALMAVGEGAISALFAPFVSDVLGGGALELGWVLSAQAVGGLIGGAFIGWIGTRVAVLRLFIVGCLVFGVIDLVIFNYSLFVPGLWIALVLFVIVGVPAIAIGTGFDTLIQRGAPDEYRGRVSGALGTVIASFGIVGTVIASILGEVVGVLPTINLQGSNYIVIGLLCLLALRLGWIALR